MISRWMSPCAFRAGLASKIVCIRLLSLIHILHRAILGSLERFIGVLTEHYAGAFPTWLAPVQAKILTVTDAQNAFAEEACETLMKQGIRAEVDTRNEKLGFKVREAQLAKIPYILVMGDKEVEARSVNVRLRTGENLGVKSLDEVAALVQEDCAEPFKMCIRDRGTGRIHRLQGQLSFLG